MKNVEKAREVRLWIGQVIVPVVIGGTILWSNPNVRHFVHSKVNNIKTKFKTRKILKPYLNRSERKFKIIKKEESE